jgi:hypothetical protein
VDLDVPVTFRNWNFAKLAWSYLALSLIMYWVNSRSSYGLGWLGIGLQVAFVATSLFYAASWAKASLRVEHDVLCLGGVFKARQFVWDQVGSISIPPPVERTPFLLAFLPWRDQALVELKDDRSYRIRGVQPRHGFTVISYFTVNQRGPADATVDSLDAFRERRTRFHAEGV